MTEIMQYINGSSHLHQLNPLTKIAAVVGVVVLTVVSSSVALIGGLIAAILIVATASRLHRELLRQVPLLLFLGITLLLLTVFTLQSGEVIGHLIPASVIGGAGLIPITAGAVDFGAILTLRFCAMLFAFQLLVITTRPTDLIDSFLALRFPVDYVLMFLISLRFIPSLQLEGQRIHEAQLSRGYNPGSGVVGKVRSLRPLFVPLVSNSLAKTRVLGLTIDMRGYRSGVGMLRRRIPFSHLDIAAFAVAGLTTLIMILGVSG